MFKENNEAKLDDAFDDTCFSTMVPRQVRGKSNSIADPQKSPQLRLSRTSCSSFFSSQSLTESPGMSFSSSTPNCRLSSMGSLSSLGPSSTPSSTSEFVIPKRTNPPRPPTMTSRAEILSQIDGKKLKGYHSLILKEMRGKLSHDEHFERPVCRSISSLDLNFTAIGLQKSSDDSLGDFTF